MSRDQKQQSRPVAIVTGATTGIGAATARALHDAGYHVFGTYRKLPATKLAQVDYVACDVTSDEAVGAAVREVLAKAGRIDLLVNNAGVGLIGAAEESSLEQAKSIFDVNLFGAIRMTKAVLPLMRQERSGRIVNISSVLGLIPAPFSALYASSKHAIEGYSESLDHELRTRGIRVSVIVPAYTKTQFDAHFMEPDAKLEEYREIRAALGNTLREVMATADPPDIVADVVLEAARAARPKLRYTAGERAGRLRLLRRFAPAALMDGGIRRDLQLDESPR